jgi:TRAP transporter 4TM/12TM fusion protein
MSLNRQSDWMVRTVSVIILILGIYDILALGGLFDYLGIYISIITHRGANVAVWLLLSYILLPARKGQTKLPWYDIVLLLAGLIPSIYVATQPGRVLLTSEQPDLISTTEIVLFLLLIASILESGRRSGGLALFFVSAFFFSVVFVGDYYPGPFYARTFSLQTIAGFMYMCLGSESVFGMIVDVGSTIVIAFMLFSGFLQASGTGEFFIRLGMALAGRYRGGPAKVAIFASALMGTISGSSVANVVTTGTFTIPMMKSLGYKRHFAGAVEAVASNGGQIMPPVMGAVAFLMAQILSMSYWSICIAAFLPAVLYYSALFFMVDFEAVKTKLSGLPKEEVPSLKETLKKDWYYFLPIILLVWLIADGTFSVQRSCMFAIVSIILINFLGGRARWFTPKKVAGAIDNGVRAMVVISGSLLACSVIVGSIQITGIGLNFTALITQFAGQSILLMLILAAFSSFILGMGMTSIPCYVICAMLVGPPLIKAGIPALAAHLFFFYWGILSFITPPVAIAALAAAGIAGADYWKTGWSATRLGAVSYIVPFFFVYQPALLLMGPANKIIIATVTSLVGCYLLSSGLMGYLLKGLNWPQRIFMVAAGLLMILPGWKTDLLGIAISGPIWFWQFMGLRAAKRAVKPTPKFVCSD